MSWKPSSSGKTESRDFPQMTGNMAVVGDKLLDNASNINYNIVKNSEHNLELPLVLNK